MTALSRFRPWRRVWWCHLRGTHKTVGGWFSRDGRCWCGWTQPDARTPAACKQFPQEQAHFGPCPTCKGTGDGPPCAGQHGCDHGLGVCNAPACRSCEGQGEVNQTYPSHLIDSLHKLHDEAAKAVTLTPAEAEGLAERTLAAIKDYANRPARPSGRESMSLAADRERVLSDLAGLQYAYLTIPVMPAHADRYSLGLHRTAALYGVAP